MIAEIGKNVECFVEEVVSKKVMEGSEQITANSSKKEVVVWVKDAMNRLDALVDEKTGVQIMENCGYNCAAVNKRIIERCKSRRKNYKSIDEFLEAEQRRPLKGTRLVRKGEALYQFYTPKAFTRPIGCYCSLLRGLPYDEKVLPTYCNCSKGFVKKFWEGVLERPVKVELMQSVVAGAPECKFVIHL
jgi:hypothetical protein